MWSRLIYSKSSAESERSGLITAYAVRIDGEVGWQVDGARLPLGDIKSWFEQSRRKVLEIRQIGERFEGYDPPSWSRSRASEEGWWFDRLLQCWWAPDESVPIPNGKPEEVESLATALSPAEYGWMDLTIASEHANTTIRCSRVFDPIPELLALMEKVIAGEYPRMSIDQEGSFAELHVLPTKLKPREGGRVDEKSPRVQFVLLIDRANVMDVGLNVIIPRRALVLSLYGAWRAVQAYDAQRLRDHWSGSEDDERDDKYDAATFRSDLIEGWLSTGPNYGQ